MSIYELQCTNAIKYVIESQKKQNKSGDPVLHLAIEEKQNLQKSSVQYRTAVRKNAFLTGFINLQ